jgi:uncharacterized membrane protein YgcG
MDRRLNLVPDGTPGDDAAVTVTLNEQALAWLAEATGLGDQLDPWMAQAMVALTLMEVLDFCAQPGHIPHYRAWVSRDVTLGDEHVREALATIPRNLLEDLVIALANGMEGGDEMGKHGDGKGADTKPGGGQGGGQHESGQVKTGGGKGAGGSNGSGKGR